MRSRSVDVPVRPPARRRLVDVPVDLTVEVDVPVEYRRRAGEVDVEFEVPVGASRVPRSWTCRSSTLEVDSPSTYRSNLSSTLE